MTEATSKPISRRTVAKGAAWTAPVILGGVAAPAYAASGGKPTIVPGSACKQPGNSCDSGSKPYGINKGYVMKFTITNTSAKDIWLYTGGTYPNYGPQITNTAGLPLVYSGGRIGGTYYAPGTHIPVPAGGTVIFLLGVSGQDDSANLVFDLTVRFQWGHTANPAGDRDHVSDPLVSTIHIDGTIPCDNCNPPADPAAAKAAAAKEEAAKSSSSSSTSSSSTSTSAKKTATAPTPIETTSPTAEPAPTSTTAP
ncbi:hypothetical protein NMQ01_11685 [Janibacter sp. CX7]|uniref:hypothetical protein n=1 Tax=Janibacter sp. CX7 TaxID=2963431 RepID=UPI0020CF875E|nr:hypothetical protein [Janibacter sp. CX7]UTT65369.1 hypothetical protein NMQ01_11685 [Janibacter sp. CX7]